MYVCKAFNVYKYFSQLVVEESGSTVWIRVDIFYTITRIYINIWQYVAISY